ncbi:unnamed protein product [Vitrella brassicaformis CCMP3155]|uniref:Uncharacterized protein n=4 Tax=Vitrella brassicaformis TaxID=1169539 RepID=A0A0G4EL35_VITBC|nr:unnamed protein product [Vitrella brassicaformis CCMP3155]|eukprot:CEL98121.1 unnamed protein product [Vitrella brassicaformis CCMP3155]
MVLPLCLEALDSREEALECIDAIIKHKAEEQSFQLSFDLSRSSSTIDSPAIEFCRHRFIVRLSASSTHAVSVSVVRLTQYEGSLSFKAEAGGGQSTEMASGDLTRADSVHAKTTLDMGESPGNVEVTVRLLKGPRVSCTHTAEGVPLTQYVVRWEDVSLIDMVSQADDKMVSVPITSTPTPCVATLRPKGIRGDGRPVVSLEATNTKGTAVVFVAEAAGRTSPPLPSAEPFQVDRRQFAKAAMKAGDALLMHLTVVRAPSIVVLENIQEACTFELRVDAFPTLLSYCRPGDSLQPATPLQWGDRYVRAVLYPRGREGQGKDKDKAVLEITQTSGGSELVTLIAKVDDVSGGPPLTLIADEPSRVDYFTGSHLEAIAAKARGCLAIKIRMIKGPTIKSVDGRSSWSSFKLRFPHFSDFSSACLRGTAIQSAAFSLPAMHIHLSDLLPSPAPRGLASLTLPSKSFALPRELQLLLCPRGDQKSETKMAALYLLKRDDTGGDKMRGSKEASTNGTAAYEASSLSLVAEMGSKPYPPVVIFSNSRTDGRRDFFDADALESVAKGNKGALEMTAHIIPGPFLVEDSAMSGRFALLIPNYDLIARASMPGYAVDFEPFRFHDSVLQALLCPAGESGSASNSTAAFYLECCRRKDGEAITYKTSCNGGQPRVLVLPPGTDCMGSPDLFERGMLTRAAQETGGLLAIQLDLLKGGLQLKEESSNRFIVRVTNLKGLLSLCEDLADDEPLQGTPFDAFGVTLRPLLYLTTRSPEHIGLFFSKDDSPSALICGVSSNTTKCAPLLLPRERGLVGRPDMLNKAQLLTEAERQGGAVDLTMDITKGPDVIVDDDQIRIEFSDLQRTTGLTAKGTRLETSGIKCRYGVLEGRLYPHGLSEEEEVHNINDPTRGPAHLVLKRLTSGVLYTCGITVRGEKYPPRLLDEERGDRCAWGLGGDAGHVLWLAGGRSLDILLHLIEGPSVTKPTLSGVSLRFESAQRFFDLCGSDHCLPCPLLSVEIDGMEWCIKASLHPHKHQQETPATLTLEGWPAPNAKEGKGGKWSGLLAVVEMTGAPGRKVELLTADGGGDDERIRGDITLPRLDELLQLCGAQGGCLELVIDFFKAPSVAVTIPKPDARPAGFLANAILQLHHFAAISQVCGVDSPIPTPRFGLPGSSASLQCSVAASGALHVTREGPADSLGPLMWVGEVNGKAHPPAHLARGATTGEVICLSLPKKKDPLDISLRIAQGITTEQQNHYEVVHFPAFDMLRAAHIKTPSVSYEVSSEPLSHGQQRLCARLVFSSGGERHGDKGRKGGFYVEFMDPPLLQSGVTAHRVEDEAGLAVVTAIETSKGSWKWNPPILLWWEPGTALPVSLRSLHVMDLDRVGRYQHEGGFHVAMRVFDAPYIASMDKEDGRGIEISPRAGQMNIRIKDEVVRVRLVIPCYRQLMRGWKSSSALTCSSFTYRSQKLAFRLTPVARASEPERHFETKASGTDLEDDETITNGLRVQLMTVEDLSVAPAAASVSPLWALEIGGVRLSFTSAADGEVHLDAGAIAAAIQGEQDLKLLILLAQPQDDGTPDVSESSSPSPSNRTGEDI